MTGISNRPIRSFVLGFFRGSFLWRLATLVVIAGIAGVVILVSGVMPVKASSGHWEITNWFLSFASSRSVATNSIGIEPPELDNPHQVHLGAVHYESGCQWCHGSPDERRPRVPLAMTPPPPYLPDSMHRWSNAELFYLVRHGIKFTGMPAWPSKVRDDDAWHVIAFLRAFPDIDSGTYRELTGRSSKPGSQEESVGGALHQCIACHGVDGNQQMGGLVPRLAGQSLTYMQNSLRAYADGTRHSGIMEAIASRLTPDEMASLVAHYESQNSSQDNLSQPDNTLLARGREIAAGDAVLGLRPIPGCAHCHEAGAEADYPQLAGQPAEYLTLQLRLFQKRERGGRHANRMYPTVDLLSDEDIEAVAAYYADLVPSP